MDKLDKLSVQPLQSSDLTNRHQSVGQETVKGSNDEGVNDELGSVLNMTQSKWYEGYGIEKNIKKAEEEAKSATKNVPTTVVNKTNYKRSFDQLFSAPLSKSLKKPRESAAVVSSSPDHHENTQNEAKNFDKPNADVEHKLITEFLDRVYYTSGRKHQEKLSKIEVQTILSYGCPIIPVNVKDCVQLRMIVMQWTTAIRFLMDGGTKKKLLYGRLFSLSDWMKFRNKQTKNSLKEVKAAPVSGFHPQCSSVPVFKKK